MVALCWTFIGSAVLCYAYAAYVILCAIALTPYYVQKMMMLHFSHFGYYTY